MPAPSDSPETPATLKCTLNRAWVLKTGVFMLVLLGFGCWALYDAAVLYPRRGLADASYRFKEFLGAADKAGLLVTHKITVASEHDELAALRGKIGDLRSAARGETQEAKAAAMEAARYEWLNALSRCWKLDAGPEYLAELNPGAKKMMFDAKTGEGYALDDKGMKAALSPQQMLNQLATLWATPPKPLYAFDLAVQWLFVVVGFGLGLYLVVLLLKCAAKAGQFRFEPGTQRLTLPGGASMTPSDLEDVDKRQWHKFYVTLITRDGAHHRLDLLRYEPLEEWVLGMERTRFPERAEEDAAVEGKSEAAVPSNEGEQPAAGAQGG